MTIFGVILIFAFGLGLLLLIPVWIWMIVNAVFISDGYAIRTPYWQCNSVGDELLSGRPDSVRNVLG